MKTVIPDNSGDDQAMVDILEESHLIRLLENKEHVVDIYEEIMEINKETRTIKNYLVLVEQAKHDLNSMVKFWTNEELAFQKAEFFSNEKLFYFLFKTA